MVILLEAYHLQLGNCATGAERNLMTEIGMKLEYYASR